MTLELTPAEVHHLLTILRDNEGWYFGGDQAEWEARAKDLTERLERIQREGEGSDRRNLFD